MYDRAAIAAQVRATLAPLLSNETTTILHACREIENAVPELVAESVEDTLSDASTQIGMTYVEAPDGMFVVGAIPHQVNVAPHPTRLSTLVMTVAAISPGDSPLVRKAAKATVHALGRFNHLQLFTSRVLADAQPLILAAATIATETAYDCLLEFTALKLRSLRSKTAAAMYGTIRSEMPSALADNVWLYAFTEGQSFYITDDAARRRAAERVAAKRIGTRRSPAHLLADFITHVLPREKTFSGEGCKDGRSVVGPFATAPYADEGVGVTEQAVYQAHGLIATPVAELNDSFVVAAYPISMVEEIQPRVTTIAPKLQKALENSTASLHQHLAELRKVSVSATDDSASNWFETLELKPNLFGVGFNLNALIAQIVHRRRQNKRKPTA